MPYTVMPYIVMPHKLIKMYQIFGKICYLHLKSNKYSDLNMWAEGFSETLVYLSQTVLFRIQEDGNIYIQVTYNTKSFHY
jgi:hypothetical protein